MAEASIMREEDEGSMLESLFRYCREGNAADIEALLTACPDLDLNASDEIGETALHVACASGRLDSVVLLLNKGANINAVTQAGETVLHFAAKYGRLIIVKYLHAQHVDVNARNEVYDMPVHLAASRGFEDVLDFLCHNGADYNAQNIRGKTPLHLSCEQCDIPTSLRLVHFACRTDLIDNLDDTALHIACREDLQPVVQTMCAYGCPVDVYNRAGLTPLHIAAQRGNSDIARCLLLSGADTERPNKDGVRAEEIALGQGHTEVADLLNKISATAILDKRDSTVKQLLPSNKLLNSIKVKVFGNSGVGKSTLVESLKCGYIRSLIRLAFPGSAAKKAQATGADELVSSGESNRRAMLIQAPQPMYTKGIDIQQVNISEAGDLSIWEFSGYEPYYLVYDQFLGEPNCIHIVVINMNDTEDTRNKQVKFWLNFIRARMAPSEPIGFAGSQLVASRVILVATHADEAHCERNSKGHYTMTGKASLVNELLKEFGADLLIAPHFFIVDANHPSSVELKSLRSSIATMKNFIVQYLAPALGFLDAAVTALSQWVKGLTDFPVVSWPQFMDYIRSKVNLLATEEHIRELTRQLQLIGEIITLKTDDDNDDMLILSPQWLCVNVIGYFISHEVTMHAHSNGRLSVDYVRTLFPRCDIGDITKILETLELTSRCQMQGDVEYDVPFLNVLECPKKLWEQEDIEMAAESDSSVWGGVQISALCDMSDQMFHVFPRLQTYLRNRLASKGNYVIYHWRLGSKIKAGSLAAVIELRPETISLDSKFRGPVEMSWPVCLELKCRGPADQRNQIFFFQEELCEIIFTVVNGCCPGMYLQRQPLSVNSLKDRRVPCSSYEPRLILLAQIDFSSTVQLKATPENSTKHAEQLIDLVAYGSEEIFSCMTAGIDLHISSLSLYARYVLASQLDPSDPLGHDWCMLAIVLGLTDLLPKVDVHEAAALSKTDAILALHSRNADATFRTLHEKLLLLDRPDAVDAMLTLIPLYRFTQTSAKRQRKTNGLNSDNPHSNSSDKGAHVKNSNVSFLVPPSNGIASESGVIKGDQAIDKLSQSKILHDAKNKLENNNGKTKSSLGNDSKTSNVISDKQNSISINSQVEKLKNDSPRSVELHAENAKLDKVEKQLEDDKQLHLEDHATDNDNDSESVGSNTNSKGSSGEPGFGKRYSENINDADDEPHVPSRDNSTTNADSITAHLSSNIMESPRTDVAHDNDKEDNVQKQDDVFASTTDDLMHSQNTDHPKLGDKDQDNRSSTAPSTSTSDNLRSQSKGDEDLTGSLRGTSKSAGKDEGSTEENEDSEHEHDENDDGSRKACEYSQDLEESDSENISNI